jgi:hypothetical protein
VDDERCDASHELFDGWRKSLRFCVRFTSGCQQGRRARTCNFTLMQFASFSVFYCAFWGSTFIKPFFREQIRRFILQTGFATICPLVLSLAAPVGTLAQDAQSKQFTAQTFASATPDTTTQAQQTSDSAAPAEDESGSGDMLTLFPHSETSRYLDLGASERRLPVASTLPSPLHRTKQPHSVAAERHHSYSHAIYRL